MIRNLEQELKEVQKSLEVEINKLESQLAPIQKQLQEARVRLAHVEALLPANTGKPVHPPPIKVKYGIWSELCRQYGLEKGVNSAHRVVKREIPSLHQSIPHKCDYDGKTYS